MFFRGIHELAEMLGFASLLSRIKKKPFGGQPRQASAASKISIRLAAPFSLMGKDV